MPSVSKEKERWELMVRRFNAFWTIILYVIIALSITDIYVNHPAELRNWSGIRALLLVAAFCANYHMFWNSTNNWPIPTHRALFYFGAQTLIFALLVGNYSNFGGLGYVLLGHISAALPLRRWPLPVGAVLTVLVYNSGIADDIRRGAWLNVADFIFNTTLFIGIAAILQLLFLQRWRLRSLVEELHQAQKQLEQSAAHAQELATLRERTRLARDMHDSLGHALVLVNVKLEAAQRLYAVEPARGATELEATRALVRATMSDLRHSLANLRQSLPRYENISVALSTAIAEIRDRSALDIVYTIPEHLPELPPETSEALWRIACEALTNVEHHAAAASISVILEQQNGALVLQIIDDGSGIQASDIARPGHYGIIGMRERTVALGGTFFVAAQAEGGTIVEVRVPIGT